MIEGVRNKRATEDTSGKLPAGTAVGAKMVEWNVCNASANWIVIPYEYGSSNLLGLEKSL